MRFLIDTDWAIHYLNDHPDVVQRLGELQDDGLALSIISLAELYGKEHPFSLDVC